MPESAAPPRSTRNRWLRAPNPWLAVPAAVVAGLLLFLAVWLAQRSGQETAPAAILPTVTAQRASEAPPLPAPQLPDTAASGSAEEAEGGVFALPDAPPEPPAAVAGTPPTDPATGSQAGLAETPAAIGDRQPIPVHSPAPTYPERALRRRLSGEVVIRVTVGTDGLPRKLEIAHSSTHRILDQAALRAVRRWRFQPAMQQGRPVAQAVHVPIEFSP